MSKAGGGWLSRLRGLFSITSAPDVQHSRRVVDAYRANLLLKAFEWCHEPSRWSDESTRRLPTKLEVEPFFDEMDKKNDTELFEYAQEQIHKQVLSLFETINNSNSSGSSSSSSSSSSSPSHATAAATKTTTATTTTTATATATSTSRLVENVGFELERRPSTIPNAGNGVFLRGKKGVLIASPGTVLAIYPGLVHLLEYSSQAGYVEKNLLPDPEFMLQVRLDGHIIDGRTAHLCNPNPYALAHLVNHVPKGGMPNVLQHMYDFPFDPLEDVLPFTSFPKHLRKHIPNAYHTRPTLFGTPDRSALMQTVVLLACRDLYAGDELLLNYRIKPDSSGARSLPSWYVPYEPEKEEIVAKNAAPV